MGMEQAFIDQVIATRSGHPGALLGILKNIQDYHPRKYLPEDTLRYVAAKMNIPFSRIYSFATFYALFNLQPQGDHTICICRGTACHTRGSRNLLEAARLELGFNVPNDGAENEFLTSPDGKFTIRTVACFGQCALAPVVEVDHHVCGHVSERTLEREIAAISKNGEHQ
jgi:NADH-quinone oxidoreductase subunit E